MKQAAAWVWGSGGLSAWVEGSHLERGDHVHHPWQDEPDLLDAPEQICGSQPTLFSSPADPAAQLVRNRAEVLPAIPLTVHDPPRNPCEVVSEGESYGDDANAVHGDGELVRLLERHALPYSLGASCHHRSGALFDVVRR